MWNLSPSARVSVPASPRPVVGARRQLVTGLLHASSLLLRAAVRLQHRPAAKPAAPSSLEYHADAGAPEGALYADGRLIGWLDGVQRL